MMSCFSAWIRGDLLLRVLRAISRKYWLLHLIKPLILRALCSVKSNCPATVQVQMDIVFLHVYCSEQVLAPERSSRAVLLPPNGVGAHAPGKENCRRTKRRSVFPGLRGSVAGTVRSPSVGPPEDCQGLHSLPDRRVALPPSRARHSYTLLPPPPQKFRAFGCIVSTVSQVPWLPGCPRQTSDYQLWKTQHRPGLKCRPNGGRCLCREVPY